MIADAEILKSMLNLAAEAIAARRASEDDNDHELLEEYERQHAEAIAMVAAMPSGAEAHADKLAGTHGYSKNAEQPTMRVTVSEDCPEILCG